MGIRSSRPARKLMRQIRHNSRGVIGQLIGVPHFGQYDGDPIETRKRNDVETLDGFDHRLLPAVCREHIRLQATVAIVPKRALPLPGLRDLPFVQRRQVHRHLLLDVML